MDAKNAESPNKRAAAGGEESKTYYVVNPDGAIHDAPWELVVECLQRPGWRKATNEEVAELKRRNGHQVPDNPICEPWNPEPD